MHSIGKQIRKRRKSLNISVNTLAKKTGLSRRFIYKIENGKGNPTIKTLEKIFEVLEVDILVFETINITGELNELLASLYRDGSLIEKSGTKVTIN